VAREVGSLENTVVIAVKIVIHALPSILNIKPTIQMQAKVQTCREWECTDKP